MTAGLRTRHILANLIACGFSSHSEHYLLVAPANKLGNALHVPQTLVILYSAIVAFLATWGVILLLRKMIKGTWFIPDLENEIDYSKNARSFFIRTLLQEIITLTLY